MYRIFTLYPVPANLVNRRFEIAAITTGTACLLGTQIPTYLSPYIFVLYQVFGMLFGIRRSSDYALLAQQLPFGTIFAVYSRAALSTPIQCFWAMRALGNETIRCFAYQTKVGVFNSSCTSKLS
jgi:hypothetical protein